MLNQQYLYCIRTYYECILPRHRTYVHELPDIIEKI